MTDLEHLFQLTDPPETDQKPILLTTVVREIKAAGYFVWLIQKHSYGLILRCEFGKKQIRVVVPPLGTDTTVIPDEQVPSYTVLDINALRIWLSCLNPAPVS